MENISIKLETSIARQIERKMKEARYTTKTEFIRDAIRGKLKELDEEAAREMAWERLFSLKGKMKGKGKFKTDEEFYKWRNEFGEKYASELAKKYGWKA